MKRVLRYQGHQVVEAKDGLDCLSIVEEAARKGEHFDVILVRDPDPDLTLT